MVESSLGEFHLTPWTYEHLSGAVGHCFLLNYRKHFVPVILIVFPRISGLTEAKKASSTQPFSHHLLQCFPSHAIKDGDSLPGIPFVADVFVKVLFITYYDSGQTDF